MEIQNTYQKTKELIQEYFTEEAASFLTGDAIRQILEKENAMIRFAEQNTIPPHAWIGSNTRRYCKDLLRRQQPLFLLYYLLGVCTEASIVLFLCYALQGILNAVSVSIPFTGVPGAVLAFFSIKESNKAYVRHCLVQEKLPQKRIRILISCLCLAAISIPLYLLWDNLSPFLRGINAGNTFLLYAELLFLSGIHNVLYSSHLLIFFSIGALKLSRRPAGEVAAAAENYIQEYEKRILAEKKQEAEDMHRDARIYADIHMEIRSRLVTRRIYLVLALFILTILDFLCIYQCFHAHQNSVLAFGISAILCTLALLLCLVSCNELIHKITRG